ncbi:MAG: hypothetical protein IJI98_08360 [Methanosphaera sp.]|nr:hypothetical protein [Bacilli bacterium]MBR0472688.1 hypothetical protein [Methanosphaera sp.]
MDNERNKNGRGIFYGVIGVATLVVAIIGATFAYFTATVSSNGNEITGNAASVSFGLTVTRAETTDQTNGGLIPMSNSMVQSAVFGGGKPSVGAGANNVACVDDNGNSVCQIYKVRVTNTSSAALFLDGYVSLHGGLATDAASTDVANNPTVMRWAQVFQDAGTTGYSTGTTDFKTVLGATNTIAIAAIGNDASGNGHNLPEIYTDGTANKTTASIYSATGATINGSQVPAIVGNYIRTSANGSADAKTGTDHTYTRTQYADALVFDLLVPVGTYKDLYFVVWLHETGTSQNPATAEAGNGFFGGLVTFMSGQGGEVSATFSGVAKTSSQGA